MGGGRTIGVELRPASAATWSALRLEQGEWARATGYVTSLDMVEYLGRMLYSGDTDNNWVEQPRCGLDAAGNMVTTIYGRPSSRSMAYQITATRGTLSDRVIVEAEEEELLDFNLSARASLRYPAISVLEAVQVGDMYDSRGGPVALPGITVSGSEIILTGAVYGRIRVRYRTLRHDYVLTVEPRTDAVENPYGSIVYAWWPGGQTYVEIEPPPGAEELLASGTACGWTPPLINGGPGIHNPGNRPKSTGADRKIVKDYCDGEVITDNTYEHTEY